MFARIEDFFINKAAGKVLLRAGVTLAAALSSGPVHDKLGALGFSVSVNPDAFAAGVITLAHWIVDAYKARRAGA